MCRLLQRAWVQTVGPESMEQKIKQKDTIAVFARMNLVLTPAMLKDILKVRTRLHCNVAL